MRLHFPDLVLFCSYLSIDKAVLADYIGIVIIKSTDFFCRSDTEHTPTVGPDKFTFAHLLELKLLSESFVLVGSRTWIGSNVLLLLFVRTHFVHNWSLTGKVFALQSLESPGGRHVQLHRSEVLQLQLRLNLCFLLDLRPIEMVCFVTEVPLKRAVKVVFLNDSLLLNAEQTQKEQYKWEHHYAHHDHGENLRLWWVWRVYLHRCRVLCPVVLCLKRGVRHYQPILSNKDLPEHVVIHKIVLPKGVNREAQLASSWKSERAFVVRVSKVVLGIEIEEAL